MRLFDKIFKKRKKADASSEELFNQLWQQLVPEGGQAETVQGELIAGFVGLQRPKKRA